MPETSPATTTDSAGITRTATGEITTPAPKTDSTSTTTETKLETQPSTDTKTTEADGKTLLTKKEGETEAKPAVPEKYEFKAPAAWADKGWELDTKLIETATPIFKDLGLSQDQAQKLVDFYAATSQADHEATENLVVEQNKKWVDAAKAEFGAKLPSMKITISKAIDGLAPATATAFRSAMDESGQGNNPDFIRAFHAFAEMLTEGGHVNGKGPSPHGQTPAGTQKRPSAAASMYPGLPSSQS